jgi:hypothetical protein
MPVIPVNKVVDQKKNNQKKWRTEEEERHKGSLTPPHKKNWQDLVRLLVEREGEAAAVAVALEGHQVLRHQRLHLAADLLAQVDRFSGRDVVERLHDHRLVLKASTAS